MQVTAQTEATDGGAVGAQRARRRAAGTEADRKACGELQYWAKRAAKEGWLKNGHFEHLFTTHFGLHRDWYAGKRILDVGCGPRGSLEWADMAAERVGIDPLADMYRIFGTDHHKMTYIACPAETIPFPDGHFDVVSSFNSLDHVDDFDRAVLEIVRILAPGGLFLLLTELGHAPTELEPVAFSWDVMDRFRPALLVLDEKHYEYTEELIYGSIRADIPYDHSNATPRYGVLSAKFVKPQGDGV